MQLLSESPQQTRRLGLALGAQLLPGDLVCLSGPLGAGKTWLAAAIGSGWGALQPLASPTFTLLHEHRRRHDATTLHHLDCYRLRDADEALQAGLATAFAGDGPALLEWPERITAILPPQRLWIELEILTPGRRRLTCTAGDARHQALLRALQQPAGA